MKTLGNEMKSIPLNCGRLSGETIDRLSAGLGNGVELAGAVYSRRGEWGLSISKPNGAFFDISATSEQGAEIQVDPDSDDSLNLRAQILSILAKESIGILGTLPGAPVKSIPMRPISLSPNNSTVTWNGEDIPLTELQGRIMRVLFDAKERLEKLTASQILALLGDHAPPRHDFRFRKTFKSCRSWEKMILIEKNRYYSLR